MLKNLCLLGSLFFTFTGCVSEEPDTKVPKDPLAIDHANSIKPSADIHCYKWPFDRQPPLFIKTKGIMVTRIMNACTTVDGEPGFAKGANWMAMGFPCTGGPGKVEWLGSFSNPKMLSFIIANSCTMAPRDAGDLGSFGVTTLKLTPDSTLLAYYPLSIQYWELTDYSEADTGFVVELRTQESMTKALADFRKNIPIRLRLYGRENAWVQGKSLYKAEVELVRSGRNGFQLTVVAASAVSDEERAALLSRCENLRPMRKCSDVFAL